VDDVVGVVVLAERDEDLLPVELVRSVALRHCARAHGGQIGSRLWLGQVHRAGPLAGDHRRQESRLLLGRAAELDRIDRTLRKQRAQIERHVGRVPHLLDRRRDEMRQRLAAVLVRLGEPVPAVGRVLLVGGLESRRRLDRAVGQELRPFAVARRIQRVENLRRELARLFEDGRHRVGRGVLEVRQGGDLWKTRQFVQDELHVGQRRVVTHGVFDGSCMASGEDSATAGAGLDAVDRPPAILHHTRPGPSWLARERALADATRDVRGRPL